VSRVDLRFRAVLFVVFRVEAAFVHGEVGSRGPVELAHSKSIGIVEVRRSMMQ
jgi:hypothetical protein